MDCSGLSDENVYVNTMVCSARRKPKINLDATVLQTDEGHYENPSSESKNDLDAIELETKEEEYEQIRCVTRQSDVGNIKEETKGKAIQWKDLPREIKIIIFTLSLMVVMLFITVIIAVVVISLPKGKGTWTLWSQWSSCDATCNNGTQTRMRMCYNPFGSTEELNCTESSTDLRECQKGPCSADGMWTHWSAWSNCGVTCGDGIQTRIRKCTNSSKVNGQPDCSGNSIDTRHCNNSPCTDGAWSNWGSWGPCSESCGGGIKSRLRRCTNPRTSSTWEGCDGSSEQIALCNKNTCDVDGIWTLWSTWSNCDVTCNNGTQTRYRMCYNPSVSSEQLNCKGSSTESMKCLQNPCSADGIWTLWSTWSNCDVTCNNGTRTRYRMCYNPSVSTGQLNCKGSSTESIKCQQNPCSENEIFKFVDGRWTLWSSWSNCDVTCDNGTQTRMRMCYSHSLTTEQLKCEGSSTESIKCQQNLCPTDGSWTHWSAWSNCDVTCGNGTKTRLRLCYNPSASTDQLTCEGNSTESIKCQQSPCSGDGSWTLWSPWSSCDAACGNGTQTRMRMCYNPSVSTVQLNCDGNSTESLKCQQNPCIDGAWSDWGSWGSCSESCGGGVKSRLRTCSNPRPSTPGEGCNGSSEQLVLCNKNTCDDHKVSFLAYGSTTLTYDTVIKFPTISFNSGNGYDSSTGRFTCKIPGIYNFAVTLTKQSQYINFINAFLQINGTNKLQMHTDPYDYSTGRGSYSLSVTGNFHLNTNDYVFVYATPYDFINGYSTSFSGVLVIPDN